MKKGTKISAFDVEGVIVSDKHVSSNKYKYTTVIVKKVSMVQIMRSVAGVHSFSSKSWIVKMPWTLKEFQSMNPSSNIKQCWEFTRKIHGLTWDQGPGEKYTTVLNEVRKCLDGGIVVVKGGDVFEKRFLGNQGMFGSYGIQMDLMPIFKDVLLDLNDFKVMKYDTHMLMSYGEVPKIHDPEKECKYFLEEGLRLLREEKINPTNYLFCK